jgi:pimeloyl-ACP methyl ester carboxylesterase
MKMKFSRTIITLSLLIFVKGYAAMNEFPKSPGIFQKEITIEDVGTLRYTLSLPKAVTSDKPLPLVLALHYGGGGTPFYGGGYLRILVEPALKDLGAVMIAPDCPGRGWTLPDSERAVMALLNRLLETYKINRKRIIVTGYSMGGIGTWYYAGKYPNLFSAAIPISARPNRNVTLEDIPVPFYVIHGEKDELFTVESIKDVVQEYKSRGTSIKLVVLDGVSHYETSLFVPPLKAAISWIREIWGNNKD